ncbi:MULTISPECIES: FAD-dependent oxidoreductase [unclassified Enterococcus]|uniref:FAD-dependent oxidoreductase n=1 Tax=unclassified Enterococcus TaxID=2608891 RepID=UPI001CE22B8B|nr:MULTISPECIES: FAD-dependent oxidoreductase [unclassified Enterococcus]MCA5012275.1 FAD-dependent oxidoreductase [Enterococcus sp. S23]MCA5015526.1 FAD-dependent oxidoreductase [Enterococcus sp. S22(2020)]
MKVVIIGASHGGLQAALALKRLDPSTEVLLIEKRTEISFISSGIILKMNGMVDELDQVRYLTSEELEEKGINIFLNTAVTALDPERKTVIFESQDGQKSELSYDKLILATGSNQFSTNLTLPSEDKVTMYKSYPSSVNALANLEKAQSISIVGGGYIGVELCDALKDQGKEIHLIESADSVLFRYLGKEISSIIEKKIIDSGINLHLNESVLGFSDTDKELFVTHTTNKEIRNNYVIVAVNARPDTTLVKDFLDLNTNGTVRVNEQMQTSDPDIYAVGDVTSYPVRNSYRKSFIPLVNNVVRSAIVAAMNVLGHTMNYNMTQRTTATKIFGCYIASTGLTEDEAVFEGIEAESIFVTLPCQMPYLEIQEEVHVKLVIEKSTHKLIGGQLMSEKDITQSINTLSLAIDKETTLEELVTMDFYFNPAINQPLGFIGQAAYEFLIKKYGV